MRFVVRTVGTSILFARFGSLWILFYLQSRETYDEKRFWSNSGVLVYYVDLPKSILKEIFFLKKSWTKGIEVKAKKKQVQFTYDKMIMIECDLALRQSSKQRVCLLISIYQAIIGIARKIWLLNCRNLFVNWIDNRFPNNYPFVFVFISRIILE